MFGKGLEYSIFSFMIKSFNIGEVWEVKNRKITRQKLLCLEEQMYCKKSNPVALITV
jgi:hypothetical protein